MDNSKPSPTSGYEIVKGVLLPARMSRKSRYPLDALGVSDCFFIPNSERILAAAAVNYLQKKTSKRFSIRTIEIDGENKIAVFRIA